MGFSLSNSFKSLISSSALIVRSEADDTNRQRGLSGGGSGGSDSHSGTGSSILDLATRTEGVSEVAVVKTANYSIMDQTKPAMIKDADYVVDVILPTILIALLFVGNAFIVYVIFQYRKRNVDNNFRKTPEEVQGEDIALNASSRNNSQV